MVCLAVGLFGFLVLGTLFDSWNSCDIFYHQVREIFHHYFFFKQVFYPLLFSSISGIPIIWILFCVTLSCISLNPSSFLLSLFSFSCLFWVLFSTLCSSSLIRSSAYSSLLLNPSTVFCSSEIVLFVSFGPC